MRFTKDELDDLRREFPRAKRYPQCSDGFCGADDCPRCHPNNFRAGVFVDDLEDEHDEDNR